jgi:hypothetical protein
MSHSPKTCFDRLLPRDLMRPIERLELPGGEGRTRAISPRGKAWINGSRLRVRFMGGNDAQHATVRTQAGWWQQVANLQFDFNGASDAEIRISFDAGDGAWSYIGTDCQSIPLDQPTMNLGFLDGGTAAHEFGHAIGLAHEHQSPFGGGILWNEPVVIKALAGSPNFWTEAVTRHNVLEKYASEQVNGTNFDPSSIMLYFFPDEWTLNGKGTKANEVLSSLDKEFVAGAKMYPKPTAPTGGPTPVSLKLGAVRTEAKIGKPGEEDLFSFHADTAGPYLMDTTGNTDVYMKLFGPHSQTALIAEDDDSGIGLNPRIRTRLLPGEYVIQVRHFSRSGVGNYSIGVIKR